MKATLASFRDQLRRIPNSGRGYALLQRFGGDLVRDMPKVEYDFEIRFDLVFNYLGRIDQRRTANSFFRPAREATGPAQSPHDWFWCLVECQAVVVDGRLVVRWIYSTNVYRRTTIEWVAEGFLEVLRAGSRVSSSSEAIGDIARAP